MPNDLAVVNQQIPAVHGETASSAVAAQSKALVEARYVIAMRKPRVWDQVRQDVLRECRRPSFANNKSAWYRKPIGQGVEGLGIRFVEVALRCMTNVIVDCAMVYEDDQKEVQRVSVTDLEANITYPLDVRVSKTVERSKPLEDGTYLSVRKNSRGVSVYTVPANDDDLLNKRAALISKAIRVLGLRIIPGDIQDEAEAIIKETRLNDAARDPDGERKRIADSFAEIGVKASDLLEYLGHSLDSCSPPELVSLRGTYGAIRDGEATWASVMDNKREQEGAPPKVLSGVEAINAKIKADAAAAAKAPAEKATTQAAAPGKETDGPKPEATWQRIEAMLNDAAHVAKDVDLLEAHATLLGQVAEEHQRERLTKLYKTLRAEMKGDK
jgi:hypothetical protein